MKTYLYDSTVGEYHLLHNGVSMGISQFSNPKLDIYPPTYSQLRGTTSTSILTEPTQVKLTYGVENLSSRQIPKIEKSLSFISPIHPPQIITQIIHRLTLPEAEVLTYVPHKGTRRQERGGPTPYREKMGKWIFNSL